MKGKARTAPTPKISKYERHALDKIDYSLRCAARNREYAESWLSEIRSKHAKKIAKEMIDMYDMGLEWSQDEI